VKRAVTERSRLIAAALSLGFPGLGHAYVGRLTRGLGLLTATYGVVLFGGWRGSWSTFAGTCLLATLLLVTWVALTADAVRLAGRSGAWKPKRYNRLTAYLGAAVLLTVVPGLVFGHSAELLGYKTYRVASSSMEPTLREGDHILVDTRRYRDATPRPGDVIVHLDVGGEETVLVKRVVAIGGQTVTIRDGSVRVDGRALDEPYVTEDNSRCPLAQTTEHHVVPEGALFVMGDRRDLSRDSRFWGPVRADLVLGRVTSVLLSPDGRRIGRRID
jgi:signal peptidase I